MIDQELNTYQSLSLSLLKADIDLSILRTSFNKFCYQSVTPYEKISALWAANTSKDFLTRNDVYQKILFSKANDSRVWPFKGAKPCLAPEFEPAFSIRQAMKQFRDTQSPNSIEIFKTTFLNSSRQAQLLFEEDMALFYNIHPLAVRQSNRDALMWAAETFLPFGYQFKKTVSTNHAHVFSKSIGPFSVSFVLHGTARMTQFWESPHHPVGKLTAYLTVHTRSPRPSFDTFRHVMTFPIYEILPTKELADGLQCENASQLGFLSSMIFQAFSLVVDPIETAIRPTLLATE